MAGTRLPSFLIGLGAGAALGLLVAPKRGEETRTDLRRGAQQGRERIARNVGELRDAAGEALDRSREAIEDQRALLESALEAGKEAYRRAERG